MSQATHAVGAGTDMPVVHVPFVLSGRLVEGGTVQGWRPALGALAIAYPDRLAGHI